MRVPAPRHAKLQRLQFQPSGTYLRGCDPSDGERPGESLWLLQPRGWRKPVWLRCQATLRARHLVLQEEAQEAAFPLPGAEALELSSILASSVAKWLASLGLHGMELLSEGGGHTLLLLDTAEAARSWVQRLNREAERTGAGWLVMADVMGRHRAEQVWAVVEEERKQLLCFDNPLDYAAGRPARTTFFLHRDALQIVDDMHPASEDVSSAIERLRRESSELAFVVKEEPELRLSMGAPDSCAHWSAFGVAFAPALRRWLEKLQTMARAGHLRKSYGGALDFEAPRLSWMEAEAEAGPFRWVNARFFLMA
ncbi:unnamed protein product [Effrenium voratum]|nr:unnamed protein product [Effrenium voratum]